MERRGLALVTMHARRRQEQALRSRIAQTFKVDLPGRPAFVTGSGIAFVGLGPQSWLVMSKADTPSFHGSFRSLVNGTASVSDQSGGYAVFRVGGGAIRDTLAKGFPIDLDDRAFKSGDAATTIVSHIGATIWRREDAPDGTACFEISLFRSLAHSFWHWFSESAAEYGLTWQDLPAAP
ncbi:sarcosine oxidase subunit gamma [Bradyrhizobium elkanii]|uniref:sarcosine oxidase subunit gamma n=1 Tax=Bradyrhizobium elkanii TaxID=29448 RepID=UPI0020132E57|nr:sarcosine oxidase subunit gamma family protein [Bradyrhizobium elkanii]